MNVAVVSLRSLHDLVSGIVDTESRSSGAHFLAFSDSRSAHWIPTIVVEELGAAVSCDGL